MPKTPENRIVERLFLRWQKYPHEGCLGLEVGGSRFSARSGHRLMTFSIDTFLLTSVPLGHTPLGIAALIVGIHW